MVHRNFMNEVYLWSTQVFISKCDLLISERNMNLVNVKLKQLIFTGNFESLKKLFDKKKTPQFFWGDFHFLELNKIFFFSFALR